MTATFIVTEAYVDGERLYVVRREDGKTFHDGVVSYNFVTVESALACRERLEAESKTRHDADESIGKTLPVYGDTDISKRSHDELTETQKKQIAFLWKMNSFETIASRTRYELKCKNCMTADYFTVATLCGDILERCHSGHRTWITKL